MPTAKKLLSLAANIQYDHRSCRGSGLEMKAAATVTGNPQQLKVFVTRSNRVVARVYDERIIEYMNEYTPRLYAHINLIFA
jgi:hypothetical protein